MPVRPLPIIFNTGKWPLFANVSGLHKELPRHGTLPSARRGPLPNCDRETTMPIRTSGKESSMWRKCDLHNHTTPNEQASDPAQPETFVKSALDARLDVVAVTNHDTLQGIEGIQEAAKETALSVVAGVEVSTDRGHILVLGPGDEGLEVLREFSNRIGLESPPEQKPFHQVVGQARDSRTAAGRPFSDLLLLIGAHVDADASLLAAKQAPGLAEQVKAAQDLDAIEVVRDEVLREWAKSGIKGTGTHVALVRGSDSHSSTRTERSTWIYLPELSPDALRHAFATPEASVRFEDAKPSVASMSIESVSFRGGLHDGIEFRFNERTHAVIGPPSSGKSLLIDAVRFAFGQECPVADINDICQRRLGNSLGEGSTVLVSGATPAGPFTLERTWGGAQKSVPPFQPIVFSQQELVRRAMEKHPSMTLLDVHSTRVHELKARLHGLAGEIETALERVVETASRVSELAARVENPEDGLGATKARISQLAGSESVAHQANQAARIDSWRSRVKEAIHEWREGFAIPPGPMFPEVPELELDEDDLLTLLPADRLREIEEQFRHDIDEAADRVSTEARRLLEMGTSRIEELNDATQAALAERGFEEGNEVLEELERLRTRVDQLEQDAAELARSRDEVDDQLREIKDLVGAAENARQELRAVRKRTCSSVNEGMSDFFVRLSEDAFTEELDALLEDAKVGTGRWRTTLGEVRNSLDRFRLLEVAVRSVEGREAPAAAEPATASQDEIAREASARGKVGVLARLATTWPGDGLELIETSTDKAFEDLTEGMRALAIKEISFAANEFPVISDQPEDAVPPQAVFRSLVPTLRVQRAERQFILASHDANLVVAGDVDQVTVLRPGDKPLTGTLFDSEIREAAIQLLEGGEDAFVVRGKRYRIS